MEQWEGKKDKTQIILKDKVFSFGIVIGTEQTCWEGASEYIFY